MIKNLFVYFAQHSFYYFVLYKAGLGESSISDKTAEFKLLSIFILNYSLECIKVYFSNSKKIDK